MSLIDMKRTSIEAYEILKEQVSQVQPPLNTDNDSVEFIESIDWPPIHSEIQLQHNAQEAPPMAPNGSRYEYIVYDEPEPRRRMARLVRSLKRLDVASAGIYHPTLVPLEDKRIAGVSTSAYTFHCLQKIFALRQLSSMAEQTKCNQRCLPLICRVQLKACKNLANGYKQLFNALLREGL